MNTEEYEKRRQQRSNASSRNNAGKISNVSVCNMHRRPTLKNDQLLDQQSATSAAAQFLDLLTSSNAAMAQSGSASTSSFCFGIPGASSINSDELMADPSSVGGEDYSMYDGEDALVMDEEEDEMVNVTGNADIDLDGQEDIKINGITSSILAAAYNNELLLSASTTSNEISGQNPLNILSSAAETALTDTAEIDSSASVVAKNQRNNKCEQLDVLSNLSLTDSAVNKSQIKNEEINFNNNASINNKLEKSDTLLENVKESVSNTSFIES